MSTGAEELLLSAQSTGEEVLPPEVEPQEDRALERAQGVTTHTLLLGCWPQCLRECSLLVLQVRLLVWPSSSPSLPLTLPSEEVEQTSSEND